MKLFCFSSWVRESGLSAWVKLWGEQRTHKSSPPPNRSPTGKVCNQYVRRTLILYGVCSPRVWAITFPFVPPRKVPSRTFPVAFRSDGTICWSAIRDGAIRWSASREGEWRERECVCVRKRARLRAWESVFAATWQELGRLWEAVASGIGEEEFEERFFFGGGFFWVQILVHQE
jgi:hypothetical protein